MEKAVKGATKIKLAAPKAKYVEAILGATNGGEAGVAEIFRTLQLRLRDSTWTIVFKSLIIAHFMIREGQTDLTLRYIAESPKRLAISNFTDVQTQGTNIRRYSDYLLEKARGYRDTKIDFVKSESGRLKRLSVDKGLLRETEAVQEQIRALLRCDMLGNHDPDNEIVLTAFRLLTMDLLELFRHMNEGTINVLEHYFEMSRPDAERALNIYKTFGRQTDQVVQYLTIARQYESLTRLEVPKLKHAPTTLTSSLEDYLNDPEFESNRRQYLAGAQRTKGVSKFAPKSESTSTPSNKAKNSDSSFPAPVKASVPVTAAPKGPAPDLIDFFDSIEQKQQTMAQPTVAPQSFSNGYPQAQQYQQTGFTQQQTGYNPFLPNQHAPQVTAYGQTISQPPQLSQLPPQPQQQAQPPQSDFTGAGFGAYTPQSQQLPPQLSPLDFQWTPSIPPNGVPSLHVQQPSQQIPIQAQATSSNPFRQSMMQTGTPMSPAVSSSPSTRHPSNPFTKSLNQPPTQTFTSSSSSPPFSNANSPFTSIPPQTQQQELQQNSTFFSPAQLPTQPSGLLPQRTGTNPFARNRSPVPNPNLAGQQQPAPAAAAATATPLLATPTGSTNPFRQSQFVNQQTGLGWQNVPGSQGTFGGYDVRHVDTVPVFPRPGAS